MAELGLAPSFSRPSGSNDNPFSEVHFRILKYRPEYPTARFASLTAVRDWVRDFVTWYNDEQRHSAIRFVTPARRHAGLDAEILARRARLCARARQASRHRWTTRTRNWARVDAVRLNSDPFDMSTLVA